MDVKNLIKEEYRKIFNQEQQHIIKASSRFEILGNHTDHNHGLCLSSTCPLYTYAAVKKSYNNKIAFFSHGFKKIEIDVSKLDYQEEDKQTSRGLIKGILLYLKNKNYSIGGFNCYCYSQVEVGSGLSSSASFEILIANIISKLFNKNKIDNIEKAKASQYAENNFYGKPSGLLDQISIVYPKIKFIDFKDLNNIKIKILPTDIFKKLQITIIKPPGNHQNLEYLYKQIPDTMYEIANIFNERFLINVKEKDIKKYSKTNEINEDKLKIVKHFYAENRRVKKGVKAILNNDINLLFKLIKESAKSNQINLKNSQIGNNYNNSLQQVIDFCNENLKDDVAIKLTGGGYLGALICFIKNNKLKQLTNLINVYHPNWKITVIKS